MRNFFTFTLLLTIVCCLGCQGGASLSGLVPCDGVVTLDGNPIEGVTIMFIPRDSGTQRDAHAMTDVAGKFKMTTLKENDGVMPGTYSVTITKYEQSGQLVATGETDPETGKPIMFETSVNRLSAVYENRTKSPLEITVPKGGTKTATFELTSK